MNITNIIKKPLVTEKSTKLAENGVYLFEVFDKTNKDSIRVAVEELFKVKVESVKISIRKGKEKRVGRKMKYKKRPDKKIAFVKLVEGSIDLFPKS